MWLFTVFALVFAFAQITPTPEPTEPPTSGWIRRTIEHDGLTRTYAVYVPPTLLEPVPLVIALHPAGGNGPQMALITRFNELADMSGVLVAYPDGPGGYWDYGAGTPQWEEVPLVRDDSGFIVAMVEAIDEEWGIDRDRIYAVGFSNGARMAYRLACELPLAAAAMVAATITDEVTAICTDDIVSVWIQHGTADMVLPFEGDPDVTIEDLRVGRALSVIETAQFFGLRNGCDNPLMAPLFEPTELAGLAEVNPVRLTLVQYQECAQGSTVEVVVAEAGGHSWTHVTAVDTSTMIWTFLGSHSRIPREDNH